VPQQDFAHACAAHIVADINADFRADVVGVARMVVTETAPCQYGAVGIVKGVDRAFVRVRGKPHFTLGNRGRRQIGRGLARGHGAVVNIDDGGQVLAQGRTDGVLHFRRPVIELVWR
jgi:hypothetical protein